MKAEWKFTTNVLGVQSATLAGVLKMQTSSVDSSATLLHPRPGRAPALVQDRGRFSSGTWVAWGTRQALNSVITEDGLIHTVIITAMTLELRVTLLFSRLVG